MRKQIHYLSVAAIAVALAACSTPKQDTAGLKAEIDASMAGHYGQSILHAEMAEENLETANEILEHWEKGYYWNIDERQKALDAARAAAEHRLQSEKELCQWLTEVHSPNHHMNEPAHRAVAYFKSGSAIAYKTDHEGLHHIAHFLASHPDSSATVTASTDTVGKPAANQKLSEKRAETVTKILVEHGVSPKQLTVKAIGEAGGPDNTPNQDHRVVVVLSSHPKYADCANLK